QSWMRRLGGQGYPTLGLVQGAKVTPVSASSFLGEPDAFARKIQELMGR
ncbi:MAG: DsbA family protein, partial [Aeromonas salmonicida]